MNQDPASQIDLRRMRTVVEVARAEAITTAAQTLGLTQSAVSRTVAEVEDALGHRLFDRLPRGIQLTERGERFVDRAKRVLAEVDDLIAEMSERPTSVTGRLRVGLAATGYYAAAALISLARQHPDVAFETAHDSAQSLCPRVLHGELDIVIGSSSYLKRWRELEVTPLRPMHFACLVRKNHPILKNDQPQEIDLLGYPLILPESIELNYSDIAQRYVHHGLPRLRPHYVTDNFELAAKLLTETEAFMPFMHPDKTLGGIDAHFVPLRDVVDMPRHYLSYARARHRPRTQVVELFEKVLVDEFPDDAENNG
ncbi:MAG: LysR family transcriptional regulator [Gammaproteobacteria bacterium]